MNSTTPNNYNHYSNWHPNADNSVRERIEIKTSVNKKDPTEIKTTVRLVAQTEFQKNVTEILQYIGIWDKTKEWASLSSENSISKIRIKTDSPLTKNPDSPVNDTANPPIADSKDRSKTSQLAAENDKINHLFSDTISKTTVESLKAQIMKPEEKALEKLALQFGHGFLDTYQSTGKREYSLPDTTKYESVIEDGKRTDKVKVTYPNGDIYVGQLSENHKPTGKGEFTSVRAKGKSRTIERYEGQFMEGKQTGQGKLVITEEQRMLHSSNEYTSFSPKTYEGKFENGQIIEGKLKVENGDVYEGTFLDNEPSGQGKLITSREGDVYEGYFENGSIVMGMWTNQLNEKYEGQFYLGEPSGTGKLEFKNNGKFEGTFEDGKPKNGTYTDPNGKKYENLIVNNKRIEQFRKGTFKS